MSIAASQTTSGAHRARLRLPSPRWISRTGSSEAAWGSRSATRSARRSSSFGASNVPDPIPAFERPWLDLPPGSTTDDTAMARNLMRSARRARGVRPRRPDATPPRVVPVGSAGRRNADRTGAPSRGARRGCGDGRARRLGATRTRGLRRQRLGDVLRAARPRLREPAGAAPPSSRRRSRRSPTSTGDAARPCWRSRSCVAALARGEPAEDAARAALAAVSDLEGGEELEFLVEAVGGSRAIDGPDQGFCLFTAGAAFQALLRGGDVETELRRVVSLGGDTDTNAAVAGALLGARDGVDGSPDRLARPPRRCRRDPSRGRSRSSRSPERGDAEHRFARRARLPECRT